MAVLLENGVGDVGGESGVAVVGQVMLEDGGGMDGAEPDGVAMKFSLSSAEQTFSVGRVTLAVAGSSA